MSNPYDDKTKKKVIELAQQYTHEYERCSQTCEFINATNPEGYFARWDYAAHMLAGMYIASALHEHAWANNTKKIDCWVCFRNAKKVFEEQLLSRDSSYKHTLNSRIASFINNSKSSHSSVRTAINNSSLDVSETIFP